ncbi:piggyBac transposable element-derived protein 4-like [Myripristis murdjan]|uniref:piggyBac transposable element-derived protein 4-like n=1 Tax=Myripristis murdjan TaxID=586833 RepID=UPI0011760EC5|nr:piggyBac transposable element-derived protein 4-like [Myripristis murdjan]
MAASAYNLFLNQDSDSHDEFLGFQDEELDDQEQQERRDLEERAGAGLGEWCQVPATPERAGPEQPGLPVFDSSRCGAQHSRLHEWKPTMEEEMERFVGIHVGMGMCAKPSIANYWSRDSTQLNWTPNYGHVMSRNRYQLINSFLHFNNNEMRRERGDDAYGALFKIHPLTEAVLHNFMEEYYPHRDLAIDESMISFRGRVFFRQYIPSKRVHFGMKSFVLTDALTNYTYLWYLYTGGAYNYDRDKGMGYSSVTQLMEKAGLLGKGHVLYTDNYYTSPALYLTLHDGGTVVHCRKNRQWMPLQLCNMNLVAGEAPVFYEKKPLLSASFRDAGTVTVLSTVHDASVFIKHVRTKGPPGYKEVVKPRCVEDYNRYMGGVDRADQLCSYYSFSHCSMKWYIHLYHHVREVALVNAHILFKEATGISMATPDFRSQVVAGLLCRPLEDAPLLPPREMPGVPARLSAVGQHLLGLREGGSKPDCKVCSSRKRGPAEGSSKTSGWKQTAFFCKTCPEQPALCPVPCFETYLTKMLYKPKYLPPEN